MTRKEKGHSSIILGDRRTTAVRALEELLAQDVMQAAEELLLEGIEGELEAFKQLGRVLVVHEEAVVKVEAVTTGVLYEFEQGLVALGVDGSGLKVELGEDAADGVGQELDLGGVLVVLGAGHFDHAAALPSEDVEEAAASVDAVL